MADLKFGILNRLNYGEKQTLGTLQCWTGNQEDGYNRLTDHKTMELPWLNNKQGKSCIPEEKYWMFKHKSPKHGWSFWIQDVKGRSEILLHPANYSRQLLGCMSPGQDFGDIDGDGWSDVTSSKFSMQQILDIMPDKWVLQVGSFEEIGVL